MAGLSEWCDNVGMAEKIRRNDFGVRFEMLPLLDVIFLLLTFFLFSQALLIHAEVLPVRLPGLMSGERGAEVDNVFGITIDAGGKLYVNRELATLEELGDRLREAKQAGEVTVFMALENRESDVDRAPMVIRIFDIAREAGVGKVNIVSEMGNGGGG